MKSSHLGGSYMSRGVKYPMGWTRATFCILGFVAVFGLFTPIDSFAIHKSDSITWQLVVISSYPACSGYHYQMTVKYNDVTEKYFELYQQENTNYKPVCMTEEKFATEFESPDDIDLLILVYDRNKGRDELHSNQIGGIYSHIGKEWTHNHTIILCDCSNFNYSDPTWILSHELSHFVLYYLGYDLSVTEKQIHDWDAKYDYCVEVANDVSCNDAKTRITGISQRYTVMTPFPSAIGQKLVDAEPTKVIFDNAFKTDMIAEITGWWVEGKILDEDYVKSLKILTGVSDFEKRIAGGFASADSAHMILTEPPKDVVDVEALEDSSQWSDEKMYDIEQMITFTDEQKRILTTEEPDKEIPQWFKSRAMWWLTDKISNEEFVSGMEYLYNK